MKFYILEADANLPVRAVWANHGDGAKRVVLGGLNELKDFVVSRDKDIALFEFSFHKIKSLGLRVKGLLPFGVVTEVDILALVTEVKEGNPVLQVANLVANCNLVSDGENAIFQRFVKD